MQLPASEIVLWQEYFSIFPFTFQAQDLHTALLAERITNMLGVLLAQHAGKRNYNGISIDKFIPDYYGEKKKTFTEKSVEQQMNDAAAFLAKVRIIERESGVKIIKKKEGGTHDFTGTHSST